MRTCRSSSTPDVTARGGCSVSCAARGGLFPFIAGLLARCRGRDSNSALRVVDQSRDWCQQRCCLLYGDDDLALAIATRASRPAQSGHGVMEVSWRVPQLGEAIEPLSARPVKGVFATTCLRGEVHHRYDGELCGGERRLYARADPSSRERVLGSRPVLLRQRE